jgi:hypothetical protein
MSVLRFVEYSVSEIRGKGLRVARQCHCHGNIMERGNSNSDFRSHVTSHLCCGCYCTAYCAPLFFLITTTIGHEILVPHDIKAYSIERKQVIMSSINDKVPEMSFAP